MGVLLDSMVWNIYADRFIISHMHREAHKHTAEIPKVSTKMKQQQ